MEGPWRVGKFWCGRAGGRGGRYSGGEGAAGVGPKWSRADTTIEGWSRSWKPRSGLCDWDNLWTLLVGFPICRGAITTPPLLTWSLSYHHVRWEIGGSLRIIKPHLCKWDIIISVEEQVWGNRTHMYNKPCPLLWTEWCASKNSVMKHQPPLGLYLEIGPLKRWLSLNEVIRMEC